MKSRFFWIFSLIFLIGAGRAQNGFQGVWNGELNFGNNKIHLVFRFYQDDNGNPACKMDSPDQGVNGIEAQTELIGNDSLVIQIPNLGASYSGKRHEKTIVGTFSQSYFKLPLNLQEGELMRNRPQTPKEPFPYRTEEVRFTNPEGGAVLSGTLSYPADYGSPDTESRSCPVVLMVSGSGLQNRDEEIFGHKPFAVIADFLARNGIASLRYDDRGTGESSGEVENATSYDFMTDALAGMDYLRETGRFGKVGVLGHSEGGAIAFMLGSRNKADFIVSLAGPGLRGDTVLAEQNRRSLLLNHASETYADAVYRILTKIFDAKIRKSDIPDAEAFVDSLIKKEQLRFPEEGRENLVVSIRTENPWMDYFLAYSPVNDIRQTRCPVMAVNGDKDFQVASGANLGSIRKNLPENPRNLVKEYAGLNHLFQHCQTGNITEYANIEESFSEEVLQDIVKWIREL